jgi:hypothetical protein
MREYDGGAASTAELYCSYANSEAATRAEVDFMITLTVFCGLTTRDIRVLTKLYKTVYMV